jgi:hypothetical protein
MPGFRHQNGDRSYRSLRLPDIRLVRGRNGSVPGLPVSFKPEVSKYYGSDRNCAIAFSKGILYLRLGQKAFALECFIASLQNAQYNWSCWLSIAQCIGSTSQVSSPGLSRFCGETITHDPKSSSLRSRLVCRGASCSTFSLCM